MRFPYNPYRVEPSPTDGSDTIWCPEQVVAVRGSNHDSEEILLNGLVDIGSDDCVLPYDVVDLVKGTPFGEGAIGDYTRATHPVAYLPVYLRIALAKEMITWPTIVAVDRERTDLALWGRCGFLNHFCVTFDGPNKHFTIRRRGPLPPGFTVSRIPGRRL
jgi:hypothetical protein